MKPEETQGVLQGNVQETNEARRHYSRGVAFLKLGRFEEALLELDKALSLDPSNEQYRLVKAAALIGLERFEDAKNELMSVLLNNHPGFSAVNTNYVNSVSPNGTTNNIKVIINELSVQLLNALRFVSTLLARAINYLMPLLKQLIARVNTLLGVLKVNLTRVVRLRSRDNRGTAQ